MFPKVDKEEEVLQRVLPPLSNNMGSPLVASKRQAGGQHYKDFVIQPMEYCHKNKLGPMESNVIKYVSRHKLKGKAKDLKKAIHMLELLLEFEYNEKYNFEEEIG